MKNLLKWPTVAYLWVGFVSCVVLIASIQQYQTRKTARDAAAFYLEACDLRMKALIQRQSNATATQPFIVPIEYSTARCACQSRVLLENFDAQTTRDVANWFRYVADHSNMRNPNKSYFSKIGVPEQRRLELAYDLAARSCYILK